MSCTTTPVVLAELLRDDAQGRFGPAAWRGTSDPSSAARGTYLRRRLRPGRRRWGHHDRAPGVLQQPAGDGVRERRSGRVQATCADGAQRSSRCGGDAFELLCAVSGALLELNVGGATVSARLMVCRAGVADVREEIRHRGSGEARADVHKRRDPPSWAATSAAR